MEEQSVDKTTYTSPIAQTIEASGNLVNNVRNPAMFFIIIAFIFIGFSVYEICDSINVSVDKLSSKIEDLTKTINAERIEHVKEIEAINQILDLKNLRKIPDEDN